jgi:hypothetical protein
MDADTNPLSRFDLERFLRNECMSKSNFGKLWVKRSGPMAKDEKLNEEAARNNNIPLLASTEDLVFLNELNDNKFLPKPKERTIKQRGYLE